MLTLRPFKKKDIPLLAHWLYGGHAASWIESPEDWLAEIHDADSAFTHLIAEVDAKPIGYCRYREVQSCYTEQEWAEIMRKLPQCAPPSKDFDLDYLIGELEYIPQGFGRVMLDRMIGLLEGQGAADITVNPDDGVTINADCRDLLESCCFLRDGGFHSYFFCDNRKTMLQPPAPA